MRAEDVRQLILSGFPEARVDVSSDDETHFEALVIATEFDGKRSLQRHQLIYGTLGEHVGRDIHALSIRAFTPEEWAARTGDK